MSFRFRKVYLEITNVCNLNCTFCPKTNRRPFFMSVQDFSIYLQRLRPYTDYLYFHLMGEPLLHPELHNFLQMAGKAGFQVIITTNGTLLAKQQDVLLSAPALHKVNISLHSMEANEGEQEFYLNDCFVFAQKAAQTKKLVSLRLWNLDGKNTKGQNRQNNMILSKLENYFTKPWQENQRGIRLTDGVFLNYGEKFQWPDMKEQDRGEHCFCYGLKDQVGVLCDGTVVPCCLDHEGDIPLGNLKKDEMNTILSSSKAQAIVYGFQSHKAVEPLCRRCGYAGRFG